MGMSLVPGAVLLCLQLIDDTLQQGYLRFGTLGLFESCCVDKAIAEKQGVYPWTLECLLSHLLG